jgi:hypothetical protein
MSEPVNSKFFDHQHKAFTAHAARYTAAIVDMRGGASQIGLGSGTCIRLGNQLFVATAAHVLKGCTVTDLRVVVKGDNGRTYLKVKKLGFQGGESDDLTDVGWLEVEPEEQVWALLPERLLLTEQRPPKCVAIVVGVPLHRASSEQRVEFSRPFLDIKTQWNLQHLGWATNIVDRADWPKDISRIYSEDYHYLLEYSGVTDLETGDRLGLIDPHGMSGGGIWMLPIEAAESPLWIPDKAVLAGIQTGFIANSHVLCGNRLKHWARLMLQDHPDVAAYIP